MSYLNKAQREGLIIIDSEKQTVVYVHQQLKRSLENPEEIVQLQAFLQLVYEYNYPTKQIRICQPVKMGSAKKEADIVVYADNHCQSPYMVVECKKEGISDTVFEEAIEQGFSYAAALSASYVWVTSQDKDAYFEVWKHSFGERKKNKLHDIPEYQAENNRWYAFKKVLYRMNAIPHKVHALSQHPLTADVAGFIVPMTLIFLLLSTLTVNFHKEISKINEFSAQFANFGLAWVYHAIVAFSAFLSFFIMDFAIPSWKILPSVKRKKYHYWGMSLFFGLPFWWLGSIYPTAWWNEVHFQKLTFKIWMFLEPFLMASPLAIMGAYCVSWFNVRQQKGRNFKKNRSTYRVRQLS
ncbi:MAG: hypothetical protein OHK0038_22980 [Flammeovirgaceae bacterium]